MPYAAQSPRPGPGRRPQPARSATDPRGLDHLGFGVNSREELVAWERRLEMLGVEYTPIRDKEFGAHLTFRDPDRIALELSTSTAVLTGWIDELREREIPQGEMEARLTEYLATLQPTVSAPGP